MNNETIWAIAGLVLIIADVVLGTFFMLFLGAGALIVALSTWIGWTPGVTAQWLVFSITSALGVILLRKKLVSMFGKNAGEKYNEHKGQSVVVSESIPAHGAGRVKYRGAEWPAKTIDGSALEEGSKAIIQDTDGILLHVEKD